MTTIRQDDFIDSVEDALQYISYYHPLDFIRALEQAWEKEESKPAKDAMAQILINSRMSAQGHRPICQDTGIVVVYVRVGMGVRWETDLGLEDMVNEGVRRAYTHPDNVPAIQDAVNTIRELLQDESTRSDAAPKWTRSSSS